MYITWKFVPIYRNKIYKLSTTINSIFKRIGNRLILWTQIKTRLIINIKIIELLIFELFKIFEIFMLLSGILFLSLGKIVFQLVILILFIVFTCLSMGMKIMNFWIPIVFIMIMVGGLMVVFSYIVRIVPNQSINQVKLRIFFFIVPIVIFIKPFFVSDFYELEWRWERLIILYFLLVMFLIILFVIDKLLKTEKGSLRRS